MVISSMKTGVLVQAVVPNESSSRALKETTPWSVSALRVPHYG